MNDRRTPEPDLRSWALDVIDSQSSLDGGGVGDQLHRICGAAVAGLGMMGAAVTMRSPRGPEAVVAHTGEVMRAVAELEFVLGEGPSQDSWDSGRPQFVSDIAAASTRWMGFATAALEAGVGAAYAVPLHVGAARFGAYATYAATPRRLDPRETRQVLVLAELATEVLLDSSTDPDGVIDPYLESALDVRSEVYQAQGMLMVSLRVGLPEALARMRAHAFASGRSLVDVAGDIIAGRLALDDDHPNP